MIIRDMMKPAQLTLSEDTSIIEAAKILSQSECPAAPVISNEGLYLGMVRASSLLGLLSEGIPDQSLSLLAIIKDTDASLSENDDAASVLAYARERLPVIRGNELAGMVNIADLKTELEYWKELANGLDAMVESAYNPLIAIDMDGCIWVFNKAAEKLMELTKEEVMGRRITDFLATSRLPEVSQTGQIQSTQKVVFGNKTFVSNRSPIHRNNELVGAVAVLQEISDLESVSQELEYVKRLNYELDAIIESSFDGLYITDGEGNTLRVNRGFERITGIPAQDHIGRNMADLVSEGFYNRSGTLLALEKRDTVTIALDTKTGKKILVTSTPIFDENNEINLVVTNVRDITELNELQRRLDQAESLSRIYKNELQQLKVATSGDFIVRSPRMEEVFRLAIRLAGVDSTVLIQGESGVGKEMIADLIHSTSTRKNGPLVKVNCGAIPEALLESELFGYEPGAFTGAKKEGKAGLFETSNGGTIFLDEIGDLPRNLQVKLLRVLQDHRVLRLGGTQTQPVDVRVLAGTNRDLNKLVDTQMFREDLYYRLNVIPVMVPPLRERVEDIAPLTDHFLRRFNAKYHMNKRLAPEVMDAFLKYHWPGNVRELENLVERLVVITAGDLVTADDLPRLSQAATQYTAIRPLKEAVEEAEKAILTSAFAKYGSTYEVARALHVNQSTVVRKAARYGLSASSNR